MLESVIPDQNDNFDDMYQLHKEETFEEVPKKTYKYQ